MSPYAEGTGVTVQRSRDEIEKILRRYGADGFGYASHVDRAMLAFTRDGRHVRFSLPLPLSVEFARTPTGRARTRLQIDAAVEAEIRRRWRALVLIVKAKLEAVDAGIVTFEEEFAMHMVLPTGTTVAEEVLPRLAAAYEGGGVPSLLPGPS